MLGTNTKRKTCKKRRLDNPKLETKIISKSDVKNLTATEYGQPLSKIFEAADVIWTPHYLFQMTINLTHPIKHTGLIYLNKELNTPDTLNNVI